MLFGILVKMEMWFELKFMGGFGKVLYLFCGDGLLVEFV